MGAYPATRGGSVSAVEPCNRPVTVLTGEGEVVDLCRELIRIDTSNYGDHSGPGEREAAEYVAEKLAEVGLEPQIFESHPGRASTVARIEGEDPSRPALLIHGHTDVVPANADGLDPPPLLRRDRRRLRVGARRGRHEGHGRDDARGRARPAAQRPQAPARHRAGLPRRRGGRRHLRGAAPGRQAPATSSRASPRRSARSAASPSPSTRSCGSTSSRPPRRACTGCGSPWTAPRATAR